jgi:Protoglobin
LSVSDDIPGYEFGQRSVRRSPVSMEELESLKQTVGFTVADRRYLCMAADVLKAQTRDIVQHWRGHIIAGIPNLARHSRALHGKPLPDYLARSNRRFEQWILDTCLRPYDQDWLNYQNEIALRHMSPIKNTTDRVESTAFVPLRDVMGFVAVMNETIKPYLGAQRHPAADVANMHQAWCRSLQLQVALWARPYSEHCGATSQW